MDQVKEYLRLAVKYRFWILVGLAPLLAVVAYATSAGGLQQQRETQVAKIEGAQKALQPYASGTVVNKQYTPLVEQKTAVVTKDVDAAWRKLYNQQAPLLTWPEAVADTFGQWPTESWPEGVATQRVYDAINTYIDVYPSYVDEVYQSFRPWDYETGEGVVVAPPAEVLLRPAVFDISSPPSYGEIQVAQKKLWIQRTMLDVVRAVNDKFQAESWDDAIIKEISELEVANATAQDQRSVVDGKQLTLPPKILAPGQEAAAEEEEEAEPAGASGSAAAAAVSSGMGGMGMGGARTGAEPVYFLESENPEQYQVVPVAMTVLIDQQHIPDLLVAFENSPMAIQVRDFDMIKPPDRVRKPVKGEMTSLMTSAGMDSGLAGGGAYARSMTTGSGMRGMMGKGYQNGGMSSGYAASINSGPMSGMGGAGGRTVDTSPSAKGGVRIDPSSINKKDEDEDKDKEKKDESTEARIADPYFYLVQVRIKGQARFYNKPPAPEPEAIPESEAPATDPAAAGTDADAVASEAPAAEGETAVEGQPEAPTGEATGAGPEAPPEAAPDQPPAEGPPEADAPPAPEGDTPDAPDAIDEPAEPGAEPAPEAGAPAPEPAPGARARR